MHSRQRSVGGCNDILLPMDEHRLLGYELEKRPWGTFERFVLNERCKVDVSRIVAACSDASKSHRHRAVFVRVLSGRGDVQIGDTIAPARQNDSFFIGQNDPYAITAHEGELRMLKIVLSPDETGVPTPA